MNNVISLWQENIAMTTLLRGTVLDAGCGSGHYSRMLRHLPGINDVISLDLFEPADDVDNETRRRYVVGMVQQLPFVDNSFDGVFCWRVMQYVPHGPTALAEFARVTRPGGLVMIRMPVDPNGVPPPHALPYQEEVTTGRRDRLTWRVYWSEQDLERHALEKGLRAMMPLGRDKSDSMVGLFEVQSC